jgi:hypothetical protein
MDNATRLGIANAFADQGAGRPDMRIGDWHLGRALRRRIPDPMLTDPASPVTQRLGRGFYTPTAGRPWSTRSNTRTRQEPTARSPDCCAGSTTTAP